MKYILFISFLLLVGCFSNEINDEPKPQEVVSDENDAEKCSFIDNKTRVKLVLLIRKMALNEQFQIFAADIIKYAQRHYMLDLHANQIVNRYINVDTMKKHLAYIDKIASETLTKKERKELYRGMAEILPVIGYETPVDDQELFELPVVHSLMCYSVGVLGVLKKYEDSVATDEQRKLVAENQKIYQQKPAVLIDMDTFFGIVEGEENLSSKTAASENSRQKNVLPTKKQNSARHFTLINPQEKAIAPGKAAENQASTSEDSGSAAPGVLKEVTDPAANQVKEKVKDTITKEVQEVLEKIE
ncbi:hypothetical protein [Candidatus Uabimicrobium sp. HlEnr_7]|uniref:hypothetical protein n=1 Tax=Candidatus Uabimicrobium helgolandensis TaxID=3095367 RepID=UPI0035573558